MGEVMKEYVAGFIAGVATVIVGHPFDTIKVKLQAHNTGNERMYRNALHCSTHILRTEGLPGLYRGATSSFIGIAVESSILFGAYSQTKTALQGGRESGKPNLQTIIPSAAYGGAMISLILCPAELVKCRMQVQGPDPIVCKDYHPRYNGPLDCAIKTVKNNGIKDLFRGGLATCLRETIGNSAFFTTYELSRYFMHSTLKSQSNLTESQKIIFDVGTGVITGGLGGMAFWTFVLPLDVAKTIIQTAPNMTISRNPFNILHSVYKQAGFRGCYAGLGPTMMRAFPANAAAIVAWEFSAKILGIPRL
ncbi:mitochondrial arginine transporter BAC1 [Nymphaea colorata]|nr:mitochondrial arginine transporter BAC1 [Nymphaea colorata]